MIDSCRVIDIKKMAYSSLKLIL
ncbi:protein of unknown function (plasmid) [Azospirillum baldaniorum]|uniref:Uncharacterized protein n=1 Tax=Azospirillum baldaniorum TaxID=1064539 RepID=A0A9P1JTW0_9PROT|nr:protein of unknown function [Azospirillum baldaniorum]